MREISRFDRQDVRLLAWYVLATMGAFHFEARSQAVAEPEKATPSNRETPQRNPELDRSGHKRVGDASFYANEFAGRRMADGALMNPQGDNAASKTLPLGTTAKVTNLDSGASAVITIQDRGPFVKGRIVDLSPSTARKIGISQNEGVAKVAVVPITVPLSGGGVKAGDAVHDATQGRPAAINQAK
jgi:rare lipoprotein A